MVAFFHKNIRYPKKVKNGETEGIVVVRFVTLKNGSIDMKKVDILKSVTEVCDKEALRLVRKMPARTPYIIGGRRPSCSRLSDNRYLFW
ncbi:energy transducer TonB [Dysgonomonas reticulitermitis]